MKHTASRIICAAVALAMLFSLCGCGQKEQSDGGSQAISKDANIPDNVIPPETEPTLAPSEPTLPDLSDVPISQNTEPTESSEPATEPAESSDSSSDETLPEESDDRRAINTLNFMNSDHIHLRFIQVTSYDGDAPFSVDREIFIDGDTKVYINDTVKTIIKDGITTVIDYNTGLYYTVEEDEDYGLNFGYDSSLYTLLSTSNSDGVYTEVYSVEGHDIVSTWDFSENGGLKVADRSVIDSSFDLFDIYVYEYSVDGMDLEVPADFTQIAPEDYELFT